MKVLLLAPGKSPHSQRLAGMLLDQGIQVTFADDTDPGLTARPGYEFIRLAPPSLLRLWGRLRGKDTLERWAGALQLRRIWRRLRPDVVNVHWIDKRADQCVLAGLHPLVLSCWGSDINSLFQPGVSPGHKKWMQNILRQSDFITADSEEVLLRCHDLAEKKIPAARFYFGINSSRFRPGYPEEVAALRRTLRIPEGSKVILSQRRLYPQLGQRNIVDAFASIASNPAAQNAVLIIRYYLDSSPELRQELQDHIQSLGLQERIFWLGDLPYDQMPACYNLADIVVNYPDQDAFPVLFFEAAMCERPVVTCRLPAYEGVFADAFITVPPGNPGALADGLLQTLSEPHQATQERTARARAIALKQGDEKNCVQALLHVFRTVAGKGTA